MDNIFSNGGNLSVDFSRYSQELLTRFRSRLLYQFKDSPVLDQLVQSIAAEPIEQYQALTDCLEKRTLAEAKGIQLDVIGDIVGQYRININGATKVWFTADVNKTDDVNVWCSPASLYENTVANDIEYRQLILSKIFKNQMTSCSIPEIRYFISLLTGETVSFMQAGNLDLYLVVKENIKSNVLSMLLTVFPDDKKNGERYFLPLSATTRLLGVAFIPIDLYSNCIGFAPDTDGGKPDYAEAAIITEV